MSDEEELDLCDHGWGWHSEHVCDEDRDHLGDHTCICGAAAAL